MTTAQNTTAAPERQLFDAGRFELLVCPDGRRTLYYFSSASVERKDALYISVVIRGTKKSAAADADAISRAKLALITMAHG